MEPIPYPLGETIFVPSSKNDGSGYFVAVGLDGRLSCTCYRYENPKQDQERDGCRHCNQVRENLMTNSETAMVLKHPTLTPVTTNLATDHELNLIGKIANTVIKTRGHAIPSSIDTPAKAAAIMLAGYEHGVKPMTALRHFFVVNGRTEPDSQIMAAICQAKEPSCYFEIAELADTHCTVRFYRPDRKEGFWEYSYYLDDAKKAGLIKGGGPWDKFPKDMMRHAAIKRLCRMAGADLINLDSSVVVSRMADLIEEGDGIDIIPDELVDLDQIPQETLYNEGDDQGDPAIMGSEPEEGAVAESDTTPEPEPASSPPDNAPEPPAEPEPEPEPAATVEDDHPGGDAPPEASVITQISAIMNELAQSWGLQSPEYMKLYDDCRKTYGQGRKFDPAQIKTQREALECLAAVRRARGDPEEGVDIEAPSTEA